MTQPILIVLTLALPFFTTWAWARAFTGPLRIVALLTLAMFALQALLVLTELACTPGTGAAPWGSCTLPGLAPLSNALAPLYAWNLAGLLTICPALLILAGIAALVRREGHQT